MSRLNWKLAAALTLALTLGFLAQSAGATSDVSVGDPIRVTRDDSLKRIGTNIWNYGGPFTITNNNTNHVFQTFCVELTENISIPGNYTVQGISTVTISGGKSLTEDIALAYTAFRGDYDGALSKGEDWWAGLQYFIWMEMYSNDEAFLRSKTSNAWVNYAKSQYDTSVSSWIAGAGNTYNLSGYGNVRIANLGANVQDQLVLVPEPATMGLMGLGLAGLAVARFRRKRA